jgi:hypothetical protein
VTCAVCHVRLPSGAASTEFFTAGKRESVCEACIPDAIAAGWFLESEADLADAPRRRRRTSVFGRLRRPEGTASAPEVPEAADAPRFSSQQGRILDRFTQRGEGPASTSTNAELKVSRALEVFNCGDEIQTVAGVARSLGTPTVTAIPVSKSSIVTITIAWELSWYRYEVDLSDESSGARLADRGYDQSELDGREQRDNVRTDDRGRLHLSRPRTA